MFSRKADDWTAEIVADGGTFDLPEIAASVPLAELYDGVDLSDAAEEPAPGRDGRVETAGAGQYEGATAGAPR